MAREAVEAAENKLKLVNAAEKIAKKALVVAADKTKIAAAKKISSSCSC